MTTKNLISLGLFCALLLFLTSCNKESIIPSEVIEEAEAPVINNAELSLYIAETGELITVNSMDEIKDLIQSKYSHLEYAQAGMEKLDIFQEELAYSKTLDLENPEVAEQYTLDVNQRYSAIASETAAERGTGIGLLYDGQATGFLAPTNIPRNLNSSKRNRASSWIGVAGFYVLCDRTWWRGQKVIVVGLASLIDLRDLGFDNRTESFF